MDARGAAGTRLTDAQPQPVEEIIDLNAIALVEKASLLLLVVLFAAWEALRPARPQRLRVEAIDLVVVFNVGLVSLICHWLLMPPSVFVAAPLGELPRAARFLVALLIIDFTLYWIHRAMHGSWLWNVHRMHHGVTSMNWLKGIHMSAGHIALYLVPQILIAHYLLGFSRLEMAALVVTGYFVQLWQHANVAIDIGPLKYVFVTPQSHRVHHARGRALRDRNFGTVLAVWDVLFGTFAAPGHEDYELGVEEQVPVVRGMIGV